jgi:flagellar hook assembly protein FlgD
MDVVIRIYDLEGRVIRIIENNVYSSGYQLEPITWDGSLEGGKRAGRGMYIYKMTVRTGAGEIAEGSGRLIIL